MNNHLPLPVADMFALRFSVHMEAADQPMKREMDRQVREPNEALDGNDGQQLTSVMRMIMTRQWGEM